MRIAVILLVAIDALIALGGAPLLLIALAYVKLDGVPGVLVAIVFVICWVIAPWTALVLAWRQRRRGAGRGRIALILLIPIPTALIAQAMLERLPLHRV